MKFGSVAVRNAEGALTVHSVRTPSRLVRKGTRIGPQEIAALEAAGVAEIVVARLEEGDVGEDEAAAGLADAIAGKGTKLDRAFTGRANIHASTAGVLVIERDGIDRLNRVDEAVTVATLPEFRPVQEGEMVGTVKIIPFAIPRAVHLAALAAARPLISVAPYRLKKVGLVSTQLAGLSSKVIDKTVRVTAERIEPAGARIVSDLRVPHETAAIHRAIADSVGAGAELVIVFGASAIADRRDVIPAAIVDAGGRIEHFGMPVDPGNLMLIGAVGAVPVIGAPGCARSPKENGFDWLLARLLAKLPVRSEDMTGLGVGGLLMEIVTRPQPRLGPEAGNSVQRPAAIVLAAGRGTRMGGPNKLLEEVDGRPILRHTVEAALASRANPVIVVTGHEARRVEEALAGLDVSLVHNPDFADGLSGSLKTGLAALPPDVDAAAVVLGDMPRVNGSLVDSLFDAINPARGVLIAVPMRAGKRGNPVVWSRRFFEELGHLEGDVGARHLIGRNAEAVIEVPVEDDAAFLDVDTPEALAAVRAHAPLQ